MGKAIIGGDDKVTFIQCVRGPMAKMNSVVRDRQNKEWYCRLTEKEFRSKGDNYAVEVYDDGVEKKFLRGYLEFVKKFG